MKWLCFIVYAKQRFFTSFERLCPTGLGKARLQGRFLQTKGQFFCLKTKSIQFLNSAVFFVNNFILKFLPLNNERM